MMSKLLPVLLIIALMPLSALAESNGASERGDILIIYDYGLSSEEEENVALLAETVAALGKGAELLTSAESAEILEQYDYVICYNITDVSGELLRAIRDFSGELMILGSDLMSEYVEISGEPELLLYEERQSRGTLKYSFSGEDSFEELVELEGLRVFETDGYVSGSVEISGASIAFCSEVCGVRFIPLTDFSGALASAALTNETAIWLGLTREYGQYIVLDEVYPFMEPQALLDRVEVLIDEGVPFVISVMPITANSDYPAMKEFCEVLSYAVANGGAVILHAPIVHEIDPELTDLQSELSDMLAAYIVNDIFPLGIEVPKSWIEDEIFLELLADFETVFIYDDGTESTVESAALNARLLESEHSLVYPITELDETGVGYLNCYRTAVYISSTETTAEELRDIAQNCAAANTRIEDLWDCDSSVATNENTILYSNGNLSLNGERVSTEFEQYEFEEDYNYGRDVFYRATVDLQSANQSLIVVVAVVAAVFTAFIFYARHRTRRHFLGKKDR